MTEKCGTEQTKTKEEWTVVSLVERFLLEKQKSGN